MKNILVIDDERDVLEIVRSVLRTKGYRVRCAEGGEEGLRQAEEDPPDLIVCDLMMPRVSGLEVIKRLRKHERLARIPIVVLSAVGSEQEKPPEYWAEGLGVDEFVPKPFDPLDLLGRVEYIFRRETYRSSSEVPLPSFEGATSTSRNPATPPPREATPPPLALDKLSPSEVAKAYTEAWNDRNWATEYNAMDPAIMGHYPLEEYKARRDEAWAEDRRTQNVVEIVSEQVSGATATVVLIREDTTTVRTFRNRITFSLKQTDTGWKVLRFKDEPAP